MIWGLIANKWSDFWSDNVAEYMPQWFDNVADAIFYKIDKILDFFLGFFRILVSVLTDLFIWILQYVLELGATLIKVISFIIPDLNLESAFAGLGTQPSDVICILNWFVPMNVLSICLSVYISAIGFYYVGGSILRWLKIVR